MPRIVYYVATSLDGYIAGKGDDISQFVFGGEAVKQYQSDLKGFSTVIMGRRTYEFGYQYGLKPGQPAYPHMEHYIFSESLELDEAAETVHIEPLSIDRVKAIRDQSPSDVYLCGGGAFAGWLLDHQLVDQLKIKLNPIVIGDGIRLFGASVAPVNWKLVERQSFPDGVQILTYDVLREIKDTQD